MIEMPMGNVDEQKGVWKGARRDGVRTANVSCGKCGRVASLSGHTISADGTVSPSLVCPHEGCDWHVWVRLMVWSDKPGEAIAK